MASAQKDWHHSGSDCCDPCSSCCLAWCCPCFLYGKIHHRIRKDSQLNDFSWCSGSCWGYYCLGICGFHWVLQMMQRGEVRTKYGLKGDGCTDCLCACCCAPCDLVQQDKEAEFRENEKRSLITQQPGAGGDVKDSGMVYPPQAHYPPQQQGHYPAQPPQQHPHQHPQMAYPPQSPPQYPQSPPLYQQQTGQIGYAAPSPQGAYPPPKN